MIDKNTSDKSPKGKHNRIACIQPLQKCLVERCDQLCLVDGYQSANSPVFHVGPILNVHHQFQSIFGHGHITDLLPQAVVGLLVCVCFRDVDDRLPSFRIIFDHFQVGHENGRVDVEIGKLDPRDDHFVDCEQLRTHNMCTHERILMDILVAIEDGDVAKELKDYLTKLTLCATANYLSYFLMSDPYKNTHELNGALSYDNMHLRILSGFITREDLGGLVDLVVGSLKIPKTILMRWLGDTHTAKHITALYCTHVIVSKHIAPLLETLRAWPDPFFEFMCIYNRIWVMGSVSYDTEMCCKHSRMLYNVRQMGLSAEYVTEPIGLNVQIRLLLGLAPRVLSPPTTVNYHEFFKDFELGLTTVVPDTSSAKDATPTEDCVPEEYVGSMHM